MEKTRFIFIVDDDEGTRESVKALVASMQAEVFCFDSAESFLEWYQGQRPAVLVTDQRMSGMSGTRMLEELRERGISISLIVMTAYPDTRSTVRAMQSGALCLLEKPCNPQELWDAVSDGLVNDLENYQRDLDYQDAHSRIETLSKGEREAIELLVEGKANKVIASRLGVSLRTIESRRAAIFSKLGVESIAELMMVWLKVNQR